MNIILEEEKPAGINTTSKPSNPSIDDELKEFLNRILPKIIVVGAGGAGNNTLNRLSANGLADSTTIAVNTDAQDLLKIKSKKKILIGKELTRGHGAGSYPEIGEAAALESIDEIRKSVEGNDIVFLTCGMGGGTGTGSLPIIAEQAKRSGVLTIAIVTVPFAMEGKKRYENAIRGLMKLEKNVDSMIIISNDKLLELYPNLPMSQAFLMADMLLSNSIQGIIEMITKPGIVNLDLADLKTIIKDMGYSIILVGESMNSMKARDAIESAMKNPLFEIDYSGAKGALINIIGGEEMRLSEAKTIIGQIIKSIGSDTRLIWGAQLDKAMNNKVKVMAVITGLPRERFEKYFDFKSYKFDLDVDVALK